MRQLDRRAVLSHATALGAAGLLPARAAAQRGTDGQGAGRAPAALPARQEFVVRGAHVLTMDAALGELPIGDVHVRDGAIVAVGATVAAPGAEVIDGRGMICMPGFVETHWHLWTSLLRPIVRADDADRKSTRLNSSHVAISYAVFCLKKKKKSSTLFIKKKKTK